MSQSASPPDASATVHPADSVIRAIALRDEWIIAVSADPHVLDGLVRADTRVIDEPDLTILPAFDDDHNHFILAAEVQSFEPDKDCRWCYIDQISI